MNNPSASIFSQATYVIRRKFFKLFGQGFYIYDGSGNVAFYSDMKAFRLRDDIRLYTGEDKQTELLAIKARQIIDFSGIFDVTDSASGRKIGALQREGWASLVRDKWNIMDPYDRIVGSIREDSTALAIARRVLAGWIPRRFEAEVGGVPVCTYSQTIFTLFPKLTLDFHSGVDQHVDRRLAIAALILLHAIERKEDRATERSESGILGSVVETIANQ